MNESYMIDVTKLYSWYRLTVGLSKQATDAVMSGVDYSKPVVILEKPDLGLSLVEQNGFKAVLPDQVLDVVTK